MQEGKKHYTTSHKHKFSLASKTSELTDSDDAIESLLVDEHLDVCGVHVLKILLYIT